MPRAKNSRKLPVLQEKAVMKRIESVITREELMGVLETTDDQRARKLLELFTDPGPSHVNASLFTLAHRAGLTAPELITLFRKHQIDLGAIRVARHIPDIMEDTAVDARSETVECWVCDGDGKITKGKGKARFTVVCAECQGKGEVRVRGDIENRKLIWESTGLINRRGPLATTNINFGGAPIESFEALVGKAGEIIDAFAQEVSDDSA